MHIAHLLRKYNPAEWGGTETAVKRLLDGLGRHGVTSALFAPAIESPLQTDPFSEAGHSVKRFHAFLPVWNLTEEQRSRLISVGGNLMSFDLLGRLLREPNVSIIHSHALNRLAGIALLAARLRRIPFVVTIHGGFMDLPAPVRRDLAAPLRGGIEWGKIFGLLLRSRRTLQKADAIITCNAREAALLAAKYPRQRIVVQPHAVPLDRYREDCRAVAEHAFPALCRRTILLAVGRIDPVKNQLWMVEQFSEILRRHPEALLVLVGGCTDASYGKALKKEARNRGLEDRVLCTGGMLPDDPRLIGIFQRAAALVLPSLSETFGLVILEAWAAGTPVLASRTSGACALIRPFENGWLFDLDAPAEFHAMLDDAFANQAKRASFREAGRRLVAEKFDAANLADRIKRLYAELVEAPSGSRDRSAFAE